MRCEVSASPPSWSSASAKVLLSEPAFSSIPAPRTVAGSAATAIISVASRIQVLELRRDRGFIHRVFLQQALQFELFPFYCALEFDELPAVGEEFVIQRVFLRLGEVEPLRNAWPAPPAPRRRLLTPGRGREHEPDEQKKTAHRGLA